jgi:glycosyltransferase involved in cell wall biosynthesis
MRQYAALIRTFNSAAYLGETLASLQAQSNPPSFYIFVDSGSTDGTRALLPPGGLFHNYTGASFNYSAAIN